MDFKNKHIEKAFLLISSLSVSGDVVDVIATARQQLVMADKDFEKKEAERDGGEYWQSAEHCDTRG